MSLSLLASKAFWAAAPHGTVLSHSTTFRSESVRSLREEILSGLPGRVAVSSWLRTKVAGVLEASPASVTIFIVLGLTEANTAQPPHRTQGPLTRASGPIAATVLSPTTAHGATTPTSQGREDHTSHSRLRQEPVVLPRRSIQRNAHAGDHFQIPLHSRAVVIDRTAGRTSGAQDPPERVGEETPRTCTSDASESEMSAPGRHLTTFDTRNARICHTCGRQKRRYPHPEFAPDSTPRVCLVSKHGLWPAKIGSGRRVGLYAGFCLPVASRRPGRRPSI